MVAKGWGRKPQKQDKTLKSLQNRVLEDNTGEAPIRAGGHSNLLRHCRGLLGSLSLWRAALQHRGVWMVMTQVAAQNRTAFGFVTCGRSWGSPRAGRCHLSLPRVCRRCCPKQHRREARTANGSAAPGAGIPHHTRVWNGIPALPVLLCTNRNWGMDEPLPLF